MQSSCLKCILKSLVPKDQTFISYSFDKSVEETVSRHFFLNFVCIFMIVSTADRLNRFQSMVKISMNWNKTEGVVHTRYPLSIHFHSYRNCLDFKVSLDWFSFFLSWA